MNFDDLAPEFKEKARACRSQEELAELAKAVGVELSDDGIVAVAGADACVRDAECTHYVIRTPCPGKSLCPDFLICVTQSCTDLTPIDCSELFDHPEKTRAGSSDSHSMHDRGQQRPTNRPACSATAAS